MDLNENLIKKREAVALKRKVQKEKKEKHRLDLLIKRRYICIVICKDVSFLLIDLFYSIEVNYAQ